MCESDFCKICLGEKQVGSELFCFLCVKESKENKGDVPLWCGECMKDLIKCEALVAHTKERYVCGEHRVVSKVKRCCSTCSRKKESDKIFKRLGGRFGDDEEDGNKSPQILASERAELEAMGYQKNEKNEEDEEDEEDDEDSEGEDSQGEVPEGEVAEGGL